MELPTCQASALSFIEELIRNYRSLDCSCCQKHLLFQNRLNPNVFLCSPKCVANYKEDSSSDTASVCSVSSSVKILDKAEAPESPSSSSFLLNLARNFDGGIIRQPQKLEFGAQDSQRHVQKSVKSEANTSRLTSHDYGNDLSVASDDLPVAANDLPAASNGLSVASNGLQGAANGISSVSNSPLVASNDLPVASNDLEKKGHSSPAHSDTSSVHSVNKKVKNENRKKNKQDPSQLFKREKPETHLRFPLGSTDFDRIPARLPARNSSPNVLQQHNSNNNYTSRQSFYHKSSNDSNWRSSNDSKNIKSWDNEPQKMFLLDLKDSKSLRNGSACQISHIWDPSRFTVQCEEDLEDLKELEREIEAHCASAGPIRRTPLVNEVILASNSGGSGDYFRAVVTKFSPKRPLVRFLDHGDEGTVDLHDCCEIPEHLAKDFSIYGAELNVTLPEDLRDEMGKVISKLQEAVTGREFIVDNIVESKPRGRWTGSLRLKDSSETYENLIEKLLKKSDDDDQRPTSDPKNGCQLFLENSRRSPSFRHKSEVAIQFMWSLSKLTLVAQEDGSNLEILEEAIAKHVGSAEPMSRDPVPGEVLLAPYNDGVYYRAEVKEVNLPEVLVEFLDYGDSKNVPATDLRELNQEIYEHPIYGVTWTMPDIPDQADDNKFKVAELQVIADRGGPAQVDVENCADSIWSGRLWVDQSQTWNDIAIKALQTPKESEEDC